jgi:hypothetical protein
MTEKRTVWVAYTNTDCTEGRGYDVPIAVCAAEATAVRLARKQYVQGSDGAWTRTRRTRDAAPAPPSAQGKSGDSDDAMCTLRQLCR